MAGRRRPVPQVSIEFDVADAAAVGPAARELQQAGYEIAAPHRREEPWGSKRFARLQVTGGARWSGISYAPAAAQPKTDRRKRPTRSPTARGRSLDYADCVRWG